MQWLFKDFERDGNGLPIGEGYPFHFFKAGTRDIGLESEGLGLYFQLMLLFIMMFVLLSLLAIPPLVDNLKSVEFANRYSVTTVGHPGVPDGQESDTCPRYWMTEMSFSSNSSIGAFCADSEYTSPYDCPATCTWDVARAMNESVCQSVEFQDILGDNCTKHTPCGENSVEYAEEDVLRSSGICMCCYLDLDPERTGDISIWQIYLYLFGVFVYLACVELVQGLSDLYASQIDESQATSADYSVLVRGLGFKDQVSNEDLKDFCRHYGEVVHVARVKKVGEVVTKSKQLSELKISCNEIKAQVQYPVDVGCGCGVFYWIFRTLYAGNTQKDLEACQQKIESLKTEIYELEKEELQNTDRAVVIFNYYDHAENMSRDFSRTWFQEIKNWATVGRLDDAPKLNGRTLSVKRAPEPTDVWWQHTHYIGRKAHNRRIISFIICNLAVAVAIVIQGIFAALASNERQQRFDLIASEQQISFTQDIQLRTLSTLYGIVVTILNIAVAYLISYLTFYEMWPTRSAHEKLYVLKLSVFYILNSAVVPALVPIIWDSIRRDASGEEFNTTVSQNFYSNGGVISQAFSIQLINAFLADVLSIFSPTYILFKVILPRFARTQEFMNLMVKPPDFALAERFSAAIKTIGLALFYGPALPISYMFALFGLTFSYWADKYVALRRCKKPQALSAEVDDLIIYLLRLLPVMQILMMGLVYFEHMQAHRVVILVVGLTIWALFMFTPIGTMIKLRRKIRESDHGGTRDQPFLSTLGAHGQLIDHDQDDVELSNAQSSAIVNNYHRRSDKQAARIVILRRFMYKPKVRLITPQFSQKLHELYDVPCEASPAITQLLEGQKADTGGEHALPPKQETNNIQFGDFASQNMAPLNQDDVPVTQQRPVPSDHQEKAAQVFQLNRYPTFQRHSAQDDDQCMHTFLPMVLYKSEDLGQGIQTQGGPASYSGQQQQQEKYPKVF
eukprot:TRINITY_DN6421_c0_g4_i2.p1 TRINITY_DN6421_c0_g4~~TRINITY_DN6421_c0_g4_i2.p1  ORF type:complete len:1030 (-),score=103.50 TRINITY_DN6421_c0_g4_i2:316-3195(-)